MNNKRMTNNEIETIYTLIERGVEQKTIAELRACSIGQVSSIKSIAKYAKNSDIENLNKINKSHGTVVRWACEKWGINLNVAAEPKQKPSTNDDLLLQTLGELLQEVKRLNEQLVKLG